MNIARVAAFAAILIIPCAAGAGPRDDLVDGMAKCGALADNAARLACYDALNPTVKAAQSEPAPPAAAPAPPAAPEDTRAWYDPSRIFGVSPVQQTEPEQFGGEALNAPPLPPGTPATPQNTPPPALDSITATVTDYAFDPYDKFVVFLDNGQVWKQLESDTGVKARFVKGGKNTVVISRGFIGSYNITINDGPSYKVRRVK